MKMQEKILKLYKETNKKLKEKIKEMKIKHKNELKEIKNEVESENEHIRKYDNKIHKYFNYAIILSDDHRFLFQKRIGFEKSFSVGGKRYLFFEKNFLYEDIVRKRFMPWIKLKYRYHVYTLNNPTPLFFNERPDHVTAKAIDDFHENTYLEKLYNLSKSGFKFGTKEMIIIGIIVIVAIYLLSGGKIV